MRPDADAEPDDYALAAELVHDAGELAARMLGEGLTVEHKTSVSDVVSAADRAAEALVADRLRRCRPNDAIVGEEGTADESTSGGDASRTWFVDPVDGTYNFLSGLPVWCAAVALDEQVGAVYQQTTGELWLGGIEQPATLNGVELVPIEDRPLAEVSLATYLHPTTLPDATRREPLLRAMQGAATVRMLGSGSVELAAVAGGRLGASVQCDSLPWDWYPGAVLVRAAGGVAEVFTAHGHSWHVTGSRRTVDDLIRLLAG